MNRRLLTYFFYVSAFMLAVGALLPSCGKNEAASPLGFNTELNIVNASPDVLPLNFYIDGQIQNGRAKYSFPNASGYFFVSKLGGTLQIRRSAGSQNVVASITDTLRDNTRYTLFITGLQRDSTVSSMFLTDTSKIPSVGYGKLRFVNASPQSQGFDLYANDVRAFANQTYKTVSKFVEIPTGTYTIKIKPSGGTDVLTTLNSFTVQDGQLYTLYTRGIVGRTDTAAFGAALILNSK